MLGVLSGRRHEQTLRKSLNIIGFLGWAWINQRKYIMDNEKGAVDEFLSGLEKPQQDPFKSADPFAPATEKEEEGQDEGTHEDDEEKDLKPLPFHKDPKVQRYVEKEIAKALKDVKPATDTTARTSSQDMQDEITDVLTRIIGNDTAEKQQAVKDFRKVLGSLEEKGATRALEQFKAQAQEATDRDKQALDDLYSGLEEVEDSFGVDFSSNTAQARKLRSDFVAYIRKIAPKDENGEVTTFPDIPSAFEEFQDKLKKPSNNRAKELASKGLSRSNDTSVAPAVAGKSWKEVDKLFSKLSN